MNTKKIKSILDYTGFSYYDPNFFEERKVTLRDGREAVLWVNKKDGHGILDSDYWVGDEYYAEEYRKTVSANVGEKTQPHDHFKIYFDLNKRQYEQFSSKLSPESSFLEIGCSFGGVLEKVANAGIRRICAIEPNVEDCDFVRRNVPSAVIFNSDMENAEIDEKFDVVASFEVLEHVVNPHTFIKRLSSLVKPGGTINIEVPNHNDSLLVHYVNPAYGKFYYHKSHIHYFTAESLSGLFSLHGFSGKVFSFQMYSFFNQMYWMYNDNHQKTALQALSWPKPNADTSTSSRIRDFLEKTDNQYKSLMNEELAGDCLVYQGKLK